MKKEINAEDILKGDTVRTEYTGTDGTPRAFEYVASIDGDTAGSGDVVFYLLNRPFQWGTVIGARSEEQRAVYIPFGPDDSRPWLSNSGWQTDGWAEEKLAGVWKIIDKPGG